MRIHMMTPVLTTGDAIGNYMISLQRAFAQLGVTVRLYADHIDPAYRHNARPTAAYRPTGNDILWFHYSIWSDNFAVLDQSTDFKVMDYHGVTPVHLMRDDPRLAALCDKAIKALPVYSRVFDWCIYHADNGLLGSGAGRIYPFLESAACLWIPPSLASRRTKNWRRWCSSWNTSCLWAGSCRRRTC